uniref:Uncharacterized protein n=1 Tax=Micrurus lemniscatus lemniscatus TaxID=129467 RepID=A0A2D4IVU1_MICLE
MGSISGKTIYVSCMDICCLIYIPDYSGPKNMRYFITTIVHKSCETIEPTEKSILKSCLTPRQRACLSKTLCSVSCPESFGICAFQPTVSLLWNILGVELCTSGKLLRLTNTGLCCGQQLLSISD